VQDTLAPSSAADGVTMGPTSTDRALDDDMEENVLDDDVEDVDANDIDGAMQIILGSARSMGIEVKG